MQGDHPTTTKLRINSRAFRQGIMRMDFKTFGGVHDDWDRTKALRFPVYQATSSATDRC